MGWLSQGICCLRQSALHCAVAAAIVLSGLAAMSFSGGCAHPVQPLALSAERIESALAQAVKAASEVSGVSDIAIRATENAEACRIAATKLVAGLTSTGSVEQVAAIKSLREAEKAALDAGRMATEAVEHAVIATNAVAAMKKLAGQAVETETSQVDKIVTKIQKLGSQCVKEAAAARKLSDELKKKWLSLSSEAMLLPPSTNSIALTVSNGVPAAGGL